MDKYPEYISEKRRPVATPDSIVENGQAHFGTFDKPFKKLNMLDCKKPCGRLMPDFMKKVVLPNGKHSKCTSTKAR